MKVAKREESFQTQAPCSVHRFVKADKHQFPLCDFLIIIIENSYLTMLIP